MQFVLFGNLYTQTVGFVPDASGNYYGAFSEGTDGTIYVAIGGVTGAVTITFYVKIEDEAPDYGTANLSNHSHGNLHLDDYSYMYTYYIIQYLGSTFNTYLTLIMGGSAIGQTWP